MAARQEHILRDDESALNSVVLCAPGFPVSADDPHKPFLLDHALALAATGTKVTVVCPAHPGAPLRQVIKQTAADSSEGEAAIEVVRVRFAPAAIAKRVSEGDSHRHFSGIARLWLVPMLIGLGWKTARLARSQDAQVVHGHWWFPAGTAAVVAARLVRSTRSAVHVHGTDMALVQGPITRWFVRRTLKAADVTVAVSQHLADEVVALRAGTAEVVAMPLRTWALSEKNQANGTPPSDGHLLAVGRLVPEKGFDVLIDAVSNLQSRANGTSAAAIDSAAASSAPTAKPAINPPIKIVIVGEGAQRASLSAQAERLGVDLELVGEVPPDQLATYYEQARLVVVPSRREGFGLATAQGLAMGRTVVASEVGAATELIKPGVNGLLTAPDNPVALADALDKAQPTWGANGPASVAHLSQASHAGVMHAAYRAV